MYVRFGRSSPKIASAKNTGVSPTRRKMFSSPPTENHAPRVSSAKPSDVTRAESDAPVVTSDTISQPGTDDESAHSAQQVRRRLATISGAIEIGRAPGVVQVTFRAPVELRRRLDARERFRSARSRHAVSAVLEQAPAAPRKGTRTALTQRLLARARHI